MRRPGRIRARKGKEAALRVRGAGRRAEQGGMAPRLVKRAGPTCCDEGDRGLRADGPAPAEWARDALELQIEPEAVTFGVDVQVRLRAVAGVAHLAEHLPG